MTEIPIVKHIKLADQKGDHTRRDAKQEAYEEQNRKIGTDNQKAAERKNNVFIIKNKEVSLSLEENPDGSMKCPFCGKLVKRLLTHFNRDKNCKLKIENNALESLKHQMESLKRRKKKENWKNRIGKEQQTEKEKNIWINVRTKLEMKY